MPVTRAPQRILVAARAHDVCSCLGYCALHLAAWGKETRRGLTPKNARQGPFLKQLCHWTMAQCPQQNQEGTWAVGAALQRRARVAAKRLRAASLLCPVRRRHQFLQRRRAAAPHHPPPAKHAGHRRGCLLSPSWRRPLHACWRLSESQKDHPCCHPLKHPEILQGCPMLQAVANSTLATAVPAGRYCWRTRYGNLVMPRVLAARRPGGSAAQCRYQQKQRRLPGVHRVGWARMMRCHYSASWARLHASLAMESGAAVHLAQGGHMGSMLRFPHHAKAPGARHTERRGVSTTVQTQGARA